MEPFVKIVIPSFRHFLKLFSSLSNRTRVFKLRTFFIICVHLKFQTSKLCFHLRLTGINSLRFNSLRRTLATFQTRLSLKSDNFPFHFPLLLLLLLVFFCEAYLDEFSLKKEIYHLSIEWLLFYIKKKTYLLSANYPFPKNNFSEPETKENFHTD